MIWYKAWLESRLRFLIAIALVMALFAFDIAQARIVMPQLGLAPAEFNEFVWRISFTRGAFICTLGTLILCPGGLLRENAVGTALFTLSLPISRRKWLATRTAVALVEAAIVALIPVVIVPLAARAGGHSYSPFEELKFSILRFLTGLGMFAFAILCSTLMQSDYGPIAMGFGFVFLIGIIARIIAPNGAFSNYITGRDFVDASWHLTIGGWPWLGMLVNMAAAALFLALAVRLQNSRDF